MCNHRTVCTELVVLLIARLLKRFLLWVVRWILSFFGQRPTKTPKRNPYNENYFTQKLIDNYGFQAAEVLPHRLRPDMQQNQWVIETEFANKHYEAIGQAITYATLSGKQPMIVFLETPTKAVKPWVKEVLEKNNIKLTIVRVDQETGEIHEIEDT